MSNSKLPKLEVSSQFSPSLCLDCAEDLNMWETHWSEQLLSLQQSISLLHLIQQTSGTLFIVKPWLKAIPFYTRTREKTIMRGGLLLSIYWMRFPLCWKIKRELRIIIHEHKSNMGNHDVESSAARRFLDTKAFKQWNTSKLSTPIAYMLVLNNFLWSS